MRWQEIYHILETYDKENRKGWYSYTWCNGFATIARKSEPEIVYTLNLRDDRVFAECPKESDESGRYYWGTYHVNGAEYITKFDLPEADDYFITTTISYPYVAMLHIKDDIESQKSGYIFKDFQYHAPSEVNEKHRNQMALNNIKAFITKWDDICYNKRRWGIYDDKIKADPLYDIIEDCAYAGMGQNEYTLASFHFNHNEYHICTAGYINKENKHRRHFKEREYLFPWVNSGLERDHVLYVQTSSLNIYKDDALKKKRKEIEEGLKLILEQSGIKDYELIPIRNTYKHYPW